MPLSYGDFSAAPPRPTRPIRNRGCFPLHPVMHIAEHHEGFAERTANAEFVSEIKSFPPGSHWLCPKRSDEDPVDYEDPDEPEEDMSAETKREMIEDGRKRYNITYKLSIVLGIDHDIAGELLAAHVTILIPPMVLA
ncbi:hypothetical protein BJ878DRAFT_531170 [Calycina marina]|uniref:Uncharacterized protein n=1 Tax=Calycina marina TaxID=1763456 RepID=A0A9P7YVD7_9HELO|nr:hypothetical protein BJ878DRAFT_531170 [Calycina marina]